MRRKIASTIECSSRVVSYPASFFCFYLPMPFVLLFFLRCLRISWSVVRNFKNEARRNRSLLLLVYPPSITPWKHATNQATSSSPKYLALSNWNFPLSPALVCNLWVRLHTIMRGCLFIISRELTQARENSEAIWNTIATDDMKL